MDYIYGKLNNKVKSVEYNGINSDTTNITVDNSDREHRTIKVDVIKTPGTLTINNTNGESVSFNGSIDENITIDSPTTEQYQELVTKVNDLENNKVDKGRPGSKWQLYGIGSKTTPLPNGNTISTAEQALPMTVINRNTNGRAEIATPINPLDIVNKQYADDGDENLAKVMPTDINVDSEHNLILEHDGTELAGQKKQVVVPPVTYTVSPVAYDKIFSFDGNSTYILGHNFLVGDLDIDNTMQVQKGIYLSSVTQPILGIYNSSNIYTTYSTGTGGEAYITTYNPDFKKQTYTFAPNKSGIVAVMTDLDTRIKKTGDTMSGDLTLVHSNLNIVSWPIANSKITFSTLPGTTPLYHISYDTTNERLEFAYESGSIAKLQYTSDCFILTSEGGKITGNLTIQGNLSVSGTTTTVDTETLKVKDNVIVTNSDKNQLIDLSGLAINTDATNTFGIMYNPTSNTVDLGLGTITTEGKFTFNENEGLPLAIRDSNSSFTQDHLISWSTNKNKLTDSGIDKSKVAQTDKTNVFVESQVFAKELQFGDSYKPSTNPLEANPTITFTKDNEVLANGTVVFQVGPIRSAYLEINEPGQTIATTSNLKTINKTSLVRTGEVGSEDIDIPVVDCNDSSGFEHNYKIEYLHSVLVKKGTGTPIEYRLPEDRFICRYHTTFPIELQSESLILRAQDITTTSHLTKLMDVDMGYNWQYDMDSVNLSELFEKDCGKIEILNPAFYADYILGTSSNELTIALTNRLKVWGRKKSINSGDSGDTNISEVWDIYIEISGRGFINNTKGTIDVEELTF